MQTITRGALFQKALDLKWCDIFAVRQFEKVLETVGEEEMAVGIDIADIARVIEALIVDGFGSFLGLVVIALHHVFASD